MSFIKRLSESFAAFMQRFGTIYESTPLTFPQLDVEKIKIKLRIKEEAMQRGASNLPLSNSKNLDDVELRIVSFIEDQIRDTSEAHNEYQRAFKDRLSRLKSTGHIERLEEITGGAVADIQKNTHQSETDIHIAKSNVKEMEDYVKEFKAKNKLERPAIYPKNKFLLVAVLFALVVFETCINGYFFAKGNELGWIGGVSSAFIPSILNLTAAYLLGAFAFRLLPHVELTKKLFGIFLSVVIPIGIFSINLLVAHYRTTMSLGLENATRVALSNLTAAPFSLGDIESWLLLIAGCFCSVIATLDFWSMDDKYLGYGKIYREQQERIDDYADQMSYSFEELAHIRDERFPELEDAYSLVTSRYGEANAILDHKARRDRMFNEYLDHLEGVGHVLIGFYRAKNCESRTDEAPKYFLREWTLDRTRISLVDNDCKSILDEFKDDILGGKEIYANCIKRINEAYSNAFNKYKTIDSLKCEVESQ